MYKKKEIIRLRFCSCACGYQFVAIGGWEQQVLLILLSCRIIFLELSGCGYQFVGGWERCCFG